MNNQFYSQFGEDVLLAEIFQGKSHGNCMEVGALDGLKDSTTLHFEKKDWTCILVEANPELAEQAKNNRRGKVFSCAAGRDVGVVEFTIAKGAEYLSTMRPTESHLRRIMGDGATVVRVSVKVMRVDDMLTEAGISHLDFATIDVEGAELDVLQGFDLERWHPKVLVVEDSSQGHDRRVRLYLKSKGYRCFLSAACNDWYARKGDWQLLNRARRLTQCGRQIRIRLYEWTVGLLPLEWQQALVRWKRLWLGKL